MKVEYKLRNKLDNLNCQKTEKTLFYKSTIGCNTLLYILHCTLLFVLNLLVLYKTIVLQQSVTARLNS